MPRDGRHAVSRPAQIDELNRRVLIPTLADGQIAFVLDAGRKTPYRLGAVPGMERPMPLVEPAFVLGPGLIERVRDVHRGELAFYRDLCDAWEDVPPGQRSPRPAGPTILPRPAPSGAGQSCVPTLGYSREAVVLALSPDHARRLLKPSPLRAADVFAEPEKGRATFATVHWAGLVDAATPWIDLAVQKAVVRTSQGEDVATVRARYDLATEHVHTVLDCLEVLRRVTRETYVDQDALVTHTLWELHDVDAAAK